MSLIKGAEVRSLDDVIKYLHQIFADDEVDVEMVMDLLASYKSNPADWKKFAKWDPHKYTRNLVDAGNGKFNLLVLCWGEAMGSSIHDHADAHCFVKVLDGSLKETMYEWPKEGEEEHPLVEKGTSIYPTNSVSYINDTYGLHRVENPSHTDGAVSLHCYIPAFDACGTYDQRSGKRRQCPITFYSKFGEKVKYSC